MQSWNCQVVVMVTVLAALDGVMLLYWRVPELH